MRMLLGWLLGGALLAAACGDDEDAAQGRGSPACQDFQDAICDFGADRCGASSRAECDQSFQGIECKSDAAATACANALNAATCGQPASGCDLGAIIDPQPAITRCETLVDAVCDHLMKCSQVSDRATCEAATTNGLNCTQAVSASLSYERCLEQLAGACGTSLPSSCQGAIRVLPAGVLGMM